MAAARRNKINTYGNKLIHTALTTIDNTEILENVIKIIGQYKNREITKHELRNSYEQIIKPQTYYEFPDTVMKNIYSFLHYIDTSYYRRASVFVIKDVRLKYLGEGGTYICREAKFQSNIFKIEDSITSTLKFKDLVNSCYCGISHEYILRTDVIDKVKLELRYCPYKCDIRFFSDRRNLGDPDISRISFTPYVENIRPLFNEQTTLKYSTNPIYFDNDIFNNYIKPFLITQNNPTYQFPSNL